MKINKKEIKQFGKTTKLKQKTLETKTNSMIVGDLTRDFMNESLLELLKADKSKNITHKEMKLSLFTLTEQLRNIAGLIDATISGPRYDEAKIELIKKDLKCAKTYLRLTKQCLKQYHENNVFNEDEIKENKFFYYEPEECSCCDPDAFCQIHNRCGDDE
jgi:hypothetical protein